MRRRNEAIERSRTSSALSAVTSVRRPRSFCGPGLWVVLERHAGRAAPPGPRRIWRGPSSSSEASAATPGARAGGTAVAGGRRRAGAQRAGVQRCGASPRAWPRPRQIASWLRASALRLASSSWRWRSSSALRRASAASRSACSMPSRLARRLASSSASRRSSTFADLGDRPARSRGRSAHPRSAYAAPRPIRRCAAWPASRGRARRRLGGTWRAAWRRPARAHGFPSRRVAADAALAALFDHDLLGPAMAEALAHGARLDARLQRQGLGRDTQSLVARRFGINHSAVLISLRCAHPHSH